LKIQLTSEGVDVAKKAIAFSLEKSASEVFTHQMEIDPQVYDLLIKQEILKSKNSILDSYVFIIQFDHQILSSLSEAQKIIFTNEFKGILGNYLDEVDLMTVRSATHYEILMSQKKVNYITDMKATLEYNLEKIINDNFQDPDHQLMVTMKTVNSSYTN
jgi:hypothetical protein